MENNVLENIRHLMQQRGMSQEFLAKQIGMQQSGFNLILSGKRDLRYDTLLKISTALKVDVTDLIKYGGDPPRQRTLLDIVAILAMQGLSSNPLYYNDPEWLAKQAYVVAEALMDILINKNQK